MSISTILPLVETLPPAEKFQLIQILLTSLAQEEGFSLQMPEQSTKQGQQMTSILQL
ncbi:MAG: hypothetical protein R3E08_07385 [Thiotrichaceae bacterium]